MKKTFLPNNPNTKSSAISDGRGKAISKIELRDGSIKSDFPNKKILTIRIYESQNPGPNNESLINDKIRTLKIIYLGESFAIKTFGVLNSEISSLENRQIGDVIPIVKTQLSKIQNLTIDFPPDFNFDEDKEYYLTVDNDLLLNEDLTRQKILANLKIPKNFSDRQIEELKNKKLMNSAKEGKALLDNQVVSNEGKEVFEILEFVPVQNFGKKNQNVRAKITVQRSYDLNSLNLQKAFVFGFYNWKLFWENTREPLVSGPHTISIQKEFNDNAWSGAKFWFWNPKIPDTGILNEVGKVDNKIRNIPVDRLGGVKTDLIFQKEDGQTDFNEAHIATGLWAHPFQVNQDGSDLDIWLGSEWFNFLWHDIRKTSTGYDVKLTQFPGVAANTGLWKNEANTWGLGIQVFKDLSSSWPIDPTDLTISNSSINYLEENNGFFSYSKTTSGGFFFENYASQIINGGLINDINYIFTPPETKENFSEKETKNGIEDGLVASIFFPSYKDDILEPLDKDSFRSITRTTGSKYGGFKGWFNRTVSSKFTSTNDTADQRDGFMDLDLKDGKTPMFVWVVNWGNQKMLLRRPIGGNEEVTWPLELQAISTFHQIQEIQDEETGRYVFNGGIFNTKKLWEKVKKLSSSSQPAFSIALPNYLRYQFSPDDINFEDEKYSEGLYLKAFEINGTHLDSSGIGLFGVGTRGYDCDWVGFNNSSTGWADGYSSNFFKFYLNNKKEDFNVQYKNINLKWSQTNRTKYMIVF